MNKIYILENFKDSFEDVSKILCSKKKNLINVRSNYISSLTPGFVKNAMDERRIDYEEQTIPRRNLQGFQRSSPYVTSSMQEKITAFAKLKDTLETIKAKFGANPQYHDSHAKFLLRNLDNALRTNINDDDFSENQSSLGSLNYIDDILNIRYGINSDKIKELKYHEIEKIILDKDNEIVHDERPLIPKAKKTENNSYDDLVKEIEILKRMILENHKPSTPGDGLKELFSNPKEERTITITIKDK